MSGLVAIEPMIDGEPVGCHFPVSISLLLVPKCTYLRKLRLRSSPGDHVLE